MSRLVQSPYNPSNKRPTPIKSDQQTTKPGTSIKNPVFTPIKPKAATTTTTSNYLKPINKTPVIMSKAPSPSPRQYFSEYLSSDSVTLTPNTYTSDNDSFDDPFRPDATVITIDNSCADDLNTSDRKSTSTKIGYEVIMQTTFDNDIYELSDKFNKQINIENSAELANRRVALKKVDRNQHMENQGLKRTPKKQVETQQQQPEYSQELMLQIENRLNLTTTSDIMVANMFECFGESPGNSKASDWREGHIKSAFNYVLIDPRVTCNLPSRAKAGMEPNEVLRAFIDAIFYIGKGSRARPYAHLHDTVRVWRHNENDVMSPSEKIPKKVRNLIEKVVEKFHPNIWKLFDII